MDWSAFACRGKVGTESGMKEEGQKDKRDPGLVRLCGELGPWLFLEELLLLGMLVGESGVELGQSF
ncbi:uncharacterized protein J3R85_014864 [Psidium guajava]|nr:uncharacterized protein J3R85_014864 [Psidium guajava]